MGNNQNTAVLTADTETAGALEFIDPATVVIDVNVRTETSLDKGFLTSIAERGVIQPVVATRDDDGTVRVRDGQRRTLAARAAELATIPVYIIGSDADGDAATIERVTDQLIANEHRTDLTDRERAIGAQQLIDLGVSRTRVAKATSLGSPKAVDAAVATAKSVAALAALDTGLTLTQAAIVAGYEDTGDTEAVEALAVAASEGLFDHKAAELAATAPQRAAYRAATAPLVEAGYELLERRPWRYDTSGLLALDTLVWAGTGEPVTGDGFDALAPHELAATLGLSADQLTPLVEVDTDECWIDGDGEPVDPSTVDWSLQDDDNPEAVAAEGMLDPRVLTEGETVIATVEWFHRDPAADGLMSGYDYRARQRHAESVAGDAHRLDTTGNGDGAADAAAVAAKADADRLERRRVLRLNKLAVAAQDVRRAKLVEVLARKTLPKGSSAIVSRMVAATMWRNADLFTTGRIDGDTKTIAAELLGGVDPIEAQAEASAERAQVITCAIVCAAHESNMPKDAWRQAGGWVGHYTDTRKTYLEFLIEVFGYTLSDVEQVVAGQIDAETISLD